MSVNDTACSPTSTCTILEGAFTNGTFYVAQYDPKAPVPHWHQRMELATICIFNSLTLILIVARIWYRQRKMKGFRADDKWMAVAGFFLIGYWASQIGTNIYGSGLHLVNVPEAWRSWHWHFEFGWAGYYIVTSCIKMSVCCCFLHILPAHFKGLRYGVYGLCTIIISLMLTMSFTWWVGCEPFDSNFIWAINSEYCINYDIFRWLWIGLSMPIDLVLTIIPLQILKRTRLKNHERKLLKMIFCATLLGTITCALGIYGVWETRLAEQNDAFYQETAFIMMNDIEIFMYALGASFPVLSRYIVQRADPGNGDLHSNFTSWARYIPNFFPTSHKTATNALAELQTEPQFRKSLHDDSTDPSFTTGERSSMPSSAAPSRTNSDAVETNLDLEKGEAVHRQTELIVSNEPNDRGQMVLMEFLRTSNVVGHGGGS